MPNTIAHGFIQGVTNVTEGTFPLTGKRRWRFLINLSSKALTIVFGVRLIINFKTAELYATGSLETDCFFQPFNPFPLINH
jgi:hypothetical protein